MHLSVKDRQNMPGPASLEACRAEEQVVMCHASCKTVNGLLGAMRTFAVAVTATSPSCRPEVQTFSLAWGLQSWSCI